jgi:hypothetical protein
MSPLRAAAAREGETAPGASESAAATEADTGAAPPDHLQASPPPGSSVADATGVFGSSAATNVVGQQQQQQIRPRTRLQSGIRKEKVYTDGTVKHGVFTSSDEPCNLEEALNDRNWKEAMDYEYMALMKNKTWHLVPPRKGINVVDCKWV